MNKRLSASDCILLEELGYSEDSIGNFNKIIKIGEIEVKITFESKTSIQIDNIVYGVDFDKEETFLREDVLKIEEQFSIQHILSNIVFEYNRNIPWIFIDERSGECMVKNTIFKIVKRTKKNKFTEYSFFLYGISEYTYKEYPGPVGKSRSANRRLYRKITKIEKTNIMSVIDQIKTTK